MTRNKNCDHVRRYIRLLFQRGNYDYVDSMKETRESTVVGRSSIDNSRARTKLRGSTRFAFVRMLLTSNMYIPFRGTTEKGTLSERSSVTSHFRWLDFIRRFFIDVIYGNKTFHFNERERKKKREKKLLEILV